MSLCCLQLTQGSLMRPPGGAVPVMCGCSRTQQRHTRKTPEERDRIPLGNVKPVSIASSKLARSQDANRAQALLTNSAPHGCWLL